MLWYKTWLETRTRFLIGLILFSSIAAGLPFMHPFVVRTLSGAGPDIRRMLGNSVDELVRMTIDYRSYIWSQWFGKNLLEMWSLFAVILGVGGLTQEVSRGSTLLTLSLPASRHRLFAVRTGVVAAELFLLALVPSLLIPALSPMAGRVFPLGDTLIHAALMAAGGMVFLGVITCLSALFTDFWKPLLIAIAVEFVLVVIRPVLTLQLARTAHSHVGVSLGFPPPSYVWYNVYGVMDAQSYFWNGTLPWAGLAINLAVALALFYASARILARRDF